MINAYAPLTLEALYDMDLPDPRWLVDGIIVQGSFALLSAREKAGKGLLTIDLCACVAAGEPFLDAAVMEGPAIYCATEENLRDVRARVQARLGRNPSFPLHVLPLNGATDDRLKLEDSRNLQQLAGMIESHEPLLVVLDTLREIHDGAEDSSDDMTWRLRPLRQLAHQTDTTIIVNHHQSKAGGFRGSTAIRAACDVELAFTRPDEASTDGLRGGLRVEGRHGPRQTWNIRFDGETSRWCLTEAINLTDTSLRGRILTLLEDTGAWMSAEELTSKIEGRRLKTIQNELSRLSRENPPPFATSGMATKGKPRRYRTLRPRLFDETTSSDDSPHSKYPKEVGSGELSPDIPNSSGNDPGGNHPWPGRSDSNGPRSGEFEP